MLRSSNATRAAWLIAATAAFIIAPIASSPFLGDDLTNSSINGQLAEHHQGLLSWVWQVSVGILVGFARFIPVTFLEMGTLFHFAPDLAAYKGAQIAILALAFVVYAWFLAEIGLNLRVAGLAVLMTLLAIQFHGHYDGYLGFNEQVEFVFILCAVSWALFARSLRMGTLWPLLGAIIVFAVSIPTYEAAFPSSLVHALIAVRMRGWCSWGKAWPFFTLSIIGFSGLALARAAFPLHEDAVYRVYFDPRVYVPTLFNQLSASLPLMYLMNFRSNILPPGTTLLRIVPWWIAAGVAITATAAMMATLFSTAQRKSSHWLPAAIGALIWVQTAVLLCAIPRYQDAIKPGYGYIFMAFGGFGAGLTIACVLVALIDKLPSAARSSAVAVVSLIYAVALCASFSTNERTLEIFETERAARINLTDALRDGIISGVPNGSIIFIDSPAQVMHRGIAMEDDLDDANNPRFFVREWSNRSVRLHDLSLRPSVLDCGRTVCTGPLNAFGLRDVPIDVRDGFTAMGRLRAASPAVDGLEHAFVDDLQFHIRGVHLAELAKNGRLAVRFKCLKSKHDEFLTMNLPLKYDAVRAGIVLRLPSSCSVDLESVSLVAVAGAAK